MTQNVPFLFFSGARLRLGITGRLGRATLKNKKRIERVPFYKQATTSVVENDQKQPVEWHCPINFQADSADIMVGDNPERGLTKLKELVAG